MGSHPQAPNKSKTTNQREAYHGFHTHRFRPGSLGQGPERAVCRGLVGLGERVELWRVAKRGVWCQGLRRASCRGPFRLSVRKLAVGAWV